MFRQYDARIGRWKSLDPEMERFPHQSPYVAYDNKPITMVDPRGDCASCPDKDDAKDGDVAVSDKGNIFMFSDGEWVPGGEIVEWLQSGKDKEERGSYFDYYAGKNGFDPTREDWDQSTFTTYLDLQTEKFGRVSAFQANYNNDLVDNLLEHFAYGGGKDYSVSLEEFKNGIRGPKMGILDFKGSLVDINRFVNSNKQQQEVSYTQLIYAGTAGSLGHYYVKLTGTLYKIAGSSTWAFTGAFSFNDPYDFQRDPKLRGAGTSIISAEGQVSFARKNLWGRPFVAKGNYEANQFMSERYLDLFKDMPTDFIEGNHIKVKRTVEQVKSYFK